MARASKRPEIALAVAAVALTLGVAEVALRWLGADLSGRQRATAALPIFYRQPTQPVGEVFFRRAGPDEWSGNALSVGLRIRVPDYVRDHGDPYADDPPITARYDADGFRNPVGLTDWEVVVVGDSFTELGTLDDVDLVTAQLARRLGRPVRNLGAAFTGPLTHTFYLERYGASPALRHAVLAFFEGNDIADLMRERAALERYHRSGARDARETVGQTSLFGLLRDIASALLDPPAPNLIAHLLERNRATFHSARGDTDVTLLYQPPSANEVAPDARRALDEALGDWARTARQLGAVPWLAYLPAKQRVLHRRLRFPPGSPDTVAAWQPTDLPLLLRKICERHGVGFMDVTPELTAESVRGRLTFNPVWDTHLNRLGARAAARAIADRLRFD